MIWLISGVESLVINVGVDAAAAAAAGRKDGEVGEKANALLLCLAGKGVSFTYIIIVLE